MAAITGASATGFTVTGVWRDAADFAVLYLYDADDFFGHPRLKYLPDFDLSGLVLSFDVAYTGLQPLESAKFPTIDWPYLDAILTDGSTRQVSLFANATQVSGNYLAAQVVLTVAASPAVAFDRVTVWYENIAFDFNAAGGETAAVVAANLAAAINGFAWDGGQAITALASGADITVSAAKPGLDGNLITLYTQSKTGTLRISPDVAPLSGGSSAATWNIVLNFSDLELTAVRQLWLTFAPALANAAEYSTTEWTAVFSNWALAGNGNKLLEVAGAGSVRVEDSDSWCAYSGSWSLQPGFYSRGFARASFLAGDSISVRYYCQSTHDLFLGTGLYAGRGTFLVSVDGDAQTELATGLATASEVFTRRLIRAGLPAGGHVVTLSNKDGNPVVFDYVEAAVRSEVPDSPGPWAGRSPAVDYDTDHGYKLSPTRLLWIYQQLGYAGELNLYMGVFWWLQKVRQGGSVPFVSLDFSQTTYLDGTGIGDGDQVFLTLSGESFGKTIFPADVGHPESIAAHFAYYLNEVAAGVWASALGPVLTITLRAVGSSYNFSFTAYKNTTATPLTFTGSLEGGTLATWAVDPTQDPVINVAAAVWMLDLFTRAKAAGINVMVSYSMELCFPPADWIALFPDATPVTTATGFGSINSSQCAPGNAAFLDYQEAVFLETATLQTMAGLPVLLQCGEFLWWYFNDAAGMAYYDPATSAAALAALGRPLHTFLAPDDNPTVNGSADATFLRNRLRDHVAAIVASVRAEYPSAEFEVLYPYDVNYPEPAGAFHVGGQLNYYVNTPPEWMHPGTLQRMKVEALDRGASSRDLDLALTAIELASSTWAWPKGLSRYLMPLDNGGCPWERELLAAEAQGLAEVILFALDHVCLFGWPLGDPEIKPSAQLL